MSPAVTGGHAERLGNLAAQLDVLAARYEAERDSRCVFTMAYALMTRRVSAGLQGSGIDDPEWVVSLAEAFGARYLAALAAFDEKGDVPGAWRAVFGTICPRRTSPLEDLVFAMAAHIVRDLPYALVDVGLSSDQGRSHVCDFHTLNAIMGSTVDDMQAEVGRRYAPYLRWLDRIGRADDEILTNYGIRLSRGMAWYNAVRLLDPDSRDAAAESVEHSPKVFIDHVMKHPILRLLRLVVAVLRRWPKTPRPA